MYLRLTAACLLAASPSVAQSAPDLVVLEGLPLPGLGSVVDAELLAVNGTADLFVAIRTDGQAADRALLRNGVVVVREGDPVAGLPFATAGHFSRVHVNDAGRVARLSQVVDSSGSATTALFIDGGLTLREGDVSSAPQLPSGTTYHRLSGVDLASDGRVVLRAEVETGGTRRDALLRIEADVDGTLLAESTLYLEGDPLPALADPMQGFGALPSALSVNASGDLLWAGDTSGPLSEDRFVLFNDTLVAREGQPSPVAGANWGSLVAPELHVNDGGDWVMKGRLDSSGTDDDVILLNGSVYLREGDTIPAIAPQVFEKSGSVGAFGTGPVFVDDLGRVAFLGKWEDAAGRDVEGHFLDGELLVQTGDVIDGLEIFDLFEADGDHVLSSNGQHLLFRAWATDGVGTPLRCVFLLSTGLGEAYCVANSNSTGAPAVASAVGSPYVGTNDVTLRCAGLPTNAFGYFITSRDRAFVPDAGGSQGNLCVGAGTGRFLALIQSSGAAGEISVPIDLMDVPTPTGPTAVVAGETWNFQCWYRDANPATTSNFSSAVAVTFR